MGVIKAEDYRGVCEDNGKILCTNCMDAPGSYKEHHFLTEEVVSGEDLYFCDECKEIL